MSAVNNNPPSEMVSERFVSEPFKGHGITAKEFVAESKAGEKPEVEGAEANREVGDTAVVGDRIGPFEVQRLVARAPGTLFLEVLDAVGAKRLLQVSRLRPCVTEDDRRDRREVERRVARRTAELVSAGGAVVHAHGGAETPTLGRVLFWALPWPVGDAGPVVSLSTPGASKAWSEREVIELGLDVASALGARHERGWVHPILSEHVLWASEQGAKGVTLFDVPVVVPVAWIDERETALRLAPEERLGGRVSVAGDVFRLGALMGELFVCAPRSAALNALLDRLMDADPDRRPSIEALSRDLSALIQCSTAAARSPGSEAVTAIVSASALGAGPGSGSDAGPASGAGVLAVSASDQKLAALAAAWAEPVLPSGESPWSAVVYPRGTHLHGHPIFEGLSGEISAQALAASAFGSPPRPSNAAVASQAAPMRADECDARARRSAFDRGQIDFDSAEFEGGHDDNEDDRADADDDLDIERAAAAAAPRSGRAVVAALAFLVVSGIVAFVGRAGDPVRDLAPVVSVPEVHELRLEVEPPNALVVSESDGRVLGRAPLTFLVGPEQEGVVLLVAKGFEPVRLSLPQRGLLRVALTPLPDVTCSVEITSPEASAITGIEANIGDGPNHTIPGAAVVRPASGWGRGARIVRCPELGGASTVRLHFAKASRALRLRIEEPRGEVVYVDERAIGTIPTETRTTRAFVSLRIGGEGASEGAAKGTEEGAPASMNETHWVLMQDDAEVRLPGRMADATAPRSSSRGKPVAPSTYAGLRPFERSRSPDDDEGD